MTVRARRIIVTTWMQLSVVGVAILFFASVLFQGEKASSKFVTSILEKPEWTAGHVYKSDYQAKHGTRLLYSFSTPDGLQHNGEVYRTKYDDMAPKLVGHTFPVVYRRGQPEFNAMTILKEDFERFRVSMPDSLLWVTRL